jgi:gamma-glutamylaminecyclotransferase
VSGEPIGLSASSFTLFVYGTLMSDGSRAHVLAGQRFLGAACTRPGYVLLDLGPYPGLVRRANGRVIEGELYEVDASLMPRLDRIEGAPALFRLERVEIEGSDGAVFAYFYQPDGAGRPVYEAARWDNSRRSR